RRACPPPPRRVFPFEPPPAPCDTRASRSVLGRDARGPPMQLTIIGAGYVGLVTGACLADFGHAVTCIDTDAARVARLRAGAIPIFEPGLETIVRRNLNEGRLRFETDAGVAVPEAEAVFIAVGTPANGGAGADLS